MNRRQTIIQFAIAFIFIAIIQGCYFDKEELLYPGSTQAVDCTTVPATYSADVSPIIIAKCAEATCHDAATASGGFIFENYNQVHDALDRVQARAIIERTMPPTAPLSPSEINILKCWIESGAPNN